MSEQSGENDVSLAIKAQNPDLETAWRTIAWWEQTCAYWREEAQKGYALRDSLVASVLAPTMPLSGLRDVAPEDEADEWALRR